MGGLGDDWASPSDDFLAELARWAANDRTARAAAERSRGRTLADQSVATSTWTGLLVDLAEARTEVSVSAGPGPARTGRLVGVAQDFVVLEQPDRGPLLMRITQIEAVTPVGPGLPSARAGERGSPSALNLAAALDALAGERAPVRVQSSGQAVVGTITGCGQDVLALKSEGTGRPAYLALNTVVWIEIR